MNKLIKTLTIVLFSLSNVIAQKDTTRNILNFYYYIGPSFSPGKLTSGESVFGKANPGLKIKAGGEFIFKNNYTIGLDYDYSFFFAMSNPLLGQKVEQLVADTHSAVVIGMNGSDDIDMGMGGVSVTLGKIFQKNKVWIQPKISIGRGVFYYDYIASYLMSAGSGTGMVSSSSQQIYYECTDKGYLSIKPEVNFSYRVLRKKYVDAFFNLGINAFYMNAKVDLIEDRSLNNNVTEVKKIMTLKEGFFIIGSYIGINVVFKKLKV